MSLTIDQKIPETSYTVVTQNIEKWVGNGFFIVIEYDSEHGNKPKFKLAKQNLNLFEYAHLDTSESDDPDEYDVSLHPSILQTKNETNH